MKIYLKIMILVFLVGFCLYEENCFAAERATFVQLTRRDVQKTEEVWEKDILLMSSAGITDIIVQWSVYGQVSFVKSDTLKYKEQYQVVDKILKVASRHNIGVYLGLTADDLYWNNVTLKADNLEDYFLLRVSLNYELASVFKELFSDYVNWKGFYISEEIDDKVWRGKKSEKIISYYLAYISGKLKKLCPDKDVLISAFFRLRTEPEDFAENMHRIFSLTKIDKILLQDGVGVDGRLLKFVPLYFEAFVKVFGKDKVWAVVEVFEQVGADNEFFAKPAASGRVLKQFVNIKNNCDKIVLFSFLDYIHPEKSAKAKALYQSLLNSESER